MSSKQTDIIKDTSLKEECKNEIIPYHGFAYIPEDCVDINTILNAILELQKKVGDLEDTIYMSKPFQSKEYK